jgi:hypothetical protein
LLTEPEKRFDTRGASAFLAERGYKTAPATLNKMRCVGGGPEFELFGRRPLYTEKALLEWVQARTTPPLRSTSDPARVCLTVKPVGKPDAGDRHGRFSGRECETARCRMAKATAPILKSVRNTARSLESKPRRHGRPRKMARPEDATP